MHRKSNTSNFIFLVSLVIIVVLSVYASVQLQSSQTVVAFIESLGYAGVFVAALVAGLNVVFPIPAATLTPLFSQAGMTIPLIIVFLTLGTLVADCIGYLIGRTSRTAVGATYPKISNLTDKVLQLNPGALVLAVTLYAAFVPLPNELILIPLAFAGVSWRLLVIPLLIGALLLQTLLVTGVSVTQIFF